MINLTTPVSQGVIKTATKFCLCSAHFDFMQCRVTFHYRLTTANGQLVAQAHQVLQDKPNDLAFTNWYNNGYPTHEALCLKAMELAGFAGTYIAEPLV